MLPIHGLFLSISSKGSFICTIPQRIVKNFPKILGEGVSIYKGLTGTFRTSCYSAHLSWGLVQDIRGDDNKQ